MEKDESDPSSEQKRIIYFFEEGRIVDSANALPKVEGIGTKLGTTTTRNAGDQKK